MTGLTQDRMTNESKIYTREGLLELIDGLPLAIAVIDQNRQVALANRAVHLFVGKKGERLIGLVGGDALGCVHTDDDPKGCGFGSHCLKCELNSSVRQTMETKEPRHMVETSMEFKGMGKRDLRVFTQPLVLRGEQMVLLALEDITEAKQHAQTVMEKERLAAIVQMAGAVCHEMGQPLMVIQGFSELLSEDLGDEETFRANILEIKNQVRRLGEISRKFSSLGRYRTKGYLGSKIIDIDGASNENSEKIRE